MDSSKEEKFKTVFNGPMNIFIYATCQKGLLLSDGTDDYAR
jgi:hypothetical protein